MIFKYTILYVDGQKLPRIHLNKGLKFWGTPCAGFDYDGKCANHIKYLNWFMLGWRGWSYFSRKSTVRVLPICYGFENELILYVT